MLEIPGGILLEGQLPSKKLRLLQAWIDIHEEELMADWSLAVNRCFRLSRCAKGAFMIEVCEVKTAPDFMLNLHFNNGEKRTFDMRPYLHYTVFGTIQGTQYPLLIRSGLADTASFSKRKTS